MNEPAMGDCGNWSEIRQRIDEVSAALAHGFAPSADDERRILKARAKELSRSMASSTEIAGLLEVVEFNLASERYAFPLTQVREVCQLRELTPVPCTPPFILGIINLRGEILAVIDLKVFFGLPASATSELNHILILHSGGMQLGLIADAIGGVRGLLPDELQSGLPTLTGHAADYLHGITHDRVVVLDATKLLTDPRLIVDEEVPG